MYIHTVLFHLYQFPQKYWSIVLWDACLVGKIEKKKKDQEYDYYKGQVMVTF